MMMMITIPSCAAARYLTALNLSRRHALYRYNTSLAVHPNAMGVEKIFFRGGNGAEISFYQL